jgi:hypothetical protein
MRFLVRCAALSFLLVAGLSLGAPQADAHGDQDQYLTNDPGCLASNFRATASTAGVIRQEFVPTGTGLQSMDFCLMLGATQAVTARVYSGTVAAPGPLLTSKTVAGITAGTAKWVHIELDTLLPTTPGNPYLLELTGSLPGFSWRGTCATIAGACTSVDPDLYPPGVSNSAVVRDFAFRTFSSTDFDGDQIADPVDNCPSIDNGPNEAAIPGVGNQTNSDADFIDQTPPYSVDDLTWVNSDADGDACDSDDDNDGMTDAAEAVDPPCASASDPTNAALADSDGDLVLDGAECAMGTDPNNAGAKPPIPSVALDPDRDQLTTAFEGTIGTNPNVKDTDGDQLHDGLEYKHYHSNPLVVNTDGGACGDLGEVTSLNNDTVVNSGDQLLLAQEINRMPPPPPLSNIDLTKDTAINSGDQLLMAIVLVDGGCP